MALLATLNNKIANKISVNFKFYNDIYVFKTCFQGRRVYIGVIKGKGEEMRSREGDIASVLNGA